jgi:hypothetical protein
MAPVSSHAMSNASVPALKEWAVVCHALVEGEQIVDLRKGGLREPRRHFGVDATAAWLYPTVEHQRAELLKPAYRHWIELAPGARVGEPITVHGFVDVVETHTITEPDVLDALGSKVIWTGDYAASRLSWKRRDPLWVLVLRAHRLLEPCTVSWDDGYGGCTSWVDLAGLPADPHSVASEPALSDEAFAARLKGVREALGAH